MSEDALYDEDVNIFVVQMRGHAMAQGMARDLKRCAKGRANQDLFKIVFHGYAVAKAMAAQAG